MIRRIVSLIWPTLKGSPIFIASKMAMSRSIGIQYEFIIQAAMLSAR